ncbi:MAG: HutD family protein [Bosea sp.]|jgi:environmental stress-induced protein Ves|nr:HutD family protein [Bosea sp. (in: a-proteobacteria)]
MHVTFPDPASYRRSPWKNGGGVTIDIAEERLQAGAEGWTGVIWRLGRTAIPSPAAFSDFAGYDRLQVVVSGSGLVLDTAQGEVDLRQPFKPARYPGEAPIQSRLESGPVEVVNLIADRRRALIDLIVVEAGETASLDAETILILAASGPAIVTLEGADHRLAPDAAIRIDAPAGASATCREGRVLVASISRLAAA